MLHTGDITHLSMPAEFDQVQQILQSARPKDVFFVPGEHDVLEDDGQQYRERFGKNTKGSGWYSFEKKGVHFVGLVNVMNLKAGGMGSLGAEQLKWLGEDVAHLSKSTPVVLFAHMPLWNIYPEWGWGTDDSAQALSLLKRFGSVTVLNGHIHINHAKGGGQRHFPHCGVNGLPATSSGSGVVGGANEGSRRTVARPLHIVRTCIFTIRSARSWRRTRSTSRASTWRRAMTKDRRITSTVR